MQELTDILEKAWLRLVSIAEMGSMVDGRIDSTQEDFNFERPACKEVNDASLPFRLWHKVRDNDPQSVSVEDTESVGLAGCPIG